MEWQPPQFLKLDILQIPNHLDYSISHNYTIENKCLVKLWVGEELIVIDLLGNLFFVEKKQVAFRKWKHLVNGRLRQIV